MLREFWETDETEKNKGYSYVNVLINISTRMQFNLFQMGNTWNKLFSSLNLEKIKFYLGYTINQKKKEKLLNQRQIQGVFNINTVFF